MTSKERKAASDALRYRATAERQIAYSIAFQKRLLQDPSKKKALRARQREANKRWKLRHPEYDNLPSIVKYASSAKGRKKRRDSERERRVTDPEFAAMKRIRARIGTAMKRGNAVKFGRTHQLLGCTIPELKDHLESLFVLGMTWDNRSLWHIDHIRPVASFDLLDPNQQKACFHYTNLQPLWKADNLAKGAAI